MRKRFVLPIAIFLFASMFAVLPVSAKGKLEFKANGKITHYRPEVTSSEVVGGQ
jgi:hypothetical protein